MKPMYKIFCLLLSILLLFSACSPTEEPSNNLPNTPSSENESNNTPPAPIEKIGYYFILLNSTKMSEEDVLAVDEITKLYPQHDIYKLDVKDCKNAAEIYEWMQRKASEIGKDPDGVQILGTVNMVPSFSIEYKIKLPESYDISDSFYSDYFYSNFDNDSSQLAQFNIADNFESENPISMVPHWRVARLLLIRGQFSDYVENYKNYLEKSKQQKNQIVSFSSSIFRYFDTTSVDDMAYFLQRAENEWKIVESPRLYTNQQGQYISPVPVLGDISTENMAQENKRAISEFFLLGHGSKNTVIRTVFDGNGNNQEQSTYLSSEQLYKVFEANPYFLNIHACNSAQGMNAGFVRTALADGCIGIFAATASIMNNGINCKASLEEMQSSSNYFAFYYAYLSALNQGLSRSHAFLAAQEAWQEILAACSEQEINYAANYQFGYHNLLCYHNFGIFEPDIA
ncbi:MAG: hypothetical protein IJW49_01345 [Clostridia bacterium]|nr:hypothetical protein [Clostridia bacterium]